MRVIVITKENMDYSRSVDTFISDFKRQTGRDLEIMSPETREGDMFCRTYDIVQYPTVIALGNDGQVQNVWSGTILPTINEVSYYVSQS